MSNDKKILFQKRYGNDLLSGLIAGWQFTGNYNDVLGTHNGSSSTTSFTTGKNGQGALFNTVTSTIDFGDDNIFTFPNGSPYSISLWVNFTTRGSLLTPFLAKRDNGPTLCEWQFYLLNGGATDNVGFIKYSGGTNTNRQDVRSNSFVTTFGIWYHVGISDAGTGDINDIKIYVNGVDDTTTRTTIGTFSNMTNTTARVRSGALPFVNSGIDIKDEIYMWNRELSPSEFALLYSSGSGKFYPFN